MRTQGALLCCAMLAAPGCLQGPIPGEASQPIIGGTLDTGDPAVVEFDDSTGGGCTAELISPHVLITAGHCVNDPQLPAGTTFSIITAADDTGATAIPVKEAHANPMYDPNADASPHDIAVVILSDPLPITPIRINRAPLTQDLVGQPVRVVGYGVTTTDQNATDDGFGKRRQATVPLISFDQSWVNAGTSTQNQCFGDSGGPAFMTIGGTEVAVGIDSFGQDTGDTCIQYNSNTRIDQELGFIDPFVQANDPGYGSGSGSGTPDMGGTGGSSGGQPGAGSGGDTGGSEPGAGNGESGGSQPGGTNLGGGAGGTSSTYSAGCSMGGGAGGGAWLLLGFVLALALRRRFASARA